MKTTGLTFAVVCSALIAGTSMAAGNAPATKKEPSAKAGDNAELVRTALDELYNSANGSSPLQYFDLTYTDNNRPPNIPGGLDGLKQSISELRMAFPDLNYRFEDVFSAGDKVVVRGSLNGTNIGPYNGRTPTLRSEVISMIEIYRLKEGKIIERWGVRDDSQLESNTNSGSLLNTGVLKPPPPIAGSVAPPPPPATPGAVSKTGAIHHQSRKPSSDSLKVKKPAVKKVVPTGSGTEKPKGTNP